MAEKGAFQANSPAQASESEREEVNMMRGVRGVLVAGWVLGGLWLASAVAQEAPTVGITGFRTGNWVFYPSASGGLVGFERGTWSVYQTPFGNVTGFQTGPWNQFQTPFGTVTGFQTGPWSVYEPPMGAGIAYQPSPWSYYRVPMGPVMSVPPYNTYSLGAAGSASTVVVPTQPRVVPKVITVR